jgi:putative restriction endonuclease
MKIWVGVTDGDWFEFLRARRPDEVNFWQPSGARSFGVLMPGEPFLFKLHSPDNFIVGGGFFVRHTGLPFSLAWEAFGEKNGVTDIARFRDRIRKYRREKEPEPNPVIGCSILTEPFFWPRERWIPIPTNWAPNIVQGKTYDSAEPIGAALWQEVVARFAGEPRKRETKELDERPRYGAEYLAHARLGQGAFRVLVTDAYQKRCAITGERTLPVLEAAHIQPYASEGPHRVSNGLLLRSDLHTLLDHGYITVTPDLRVLVSKRIREEFENGRDYYAHHDKPLRIVPEQALERPDPYFLRWHNEERYERGAIAVASQTLSAD